MSYCYEYPRPAVTTDAIIITKNNQGTYLLLIQRGIEPFMGNWALPGGFIELHEELADACSRELMEETGLTEIQLQQYSTYGGVKRDPRGRTISIVFWAEIASKQEIISGDDAQNAQWFNLNNLPALAFDHEKIIRDFIQEKLS